MAVEQGCLLFTGSSAEDGERERELAMAFCARRVDGLVIVPSGTDHSYLSPEIASGTPVVFVDRPAAGIDADAVLSDNAGGARQGVTHLIRHGHRRIGFVGDLPGIHTCAERLRGYREAMAQAHLPVDERWIATGPTTPPRSVGPLPACWRDRSPSRHCSPPTTGSPRRPSACSDVTAGGQPCWGSTTSNSPRFSRPG